MTNDTYMLLLLTIIATCALLACMKYLQLRDPVQAAALPGPAKTFRVSGVAPTA